MKESLRLCRENNIFIDPLFYLELSENASFICSSFIEDKSYPLPQRRLKTDRSHCIIRSFGNISTSLFLNALFFDPVKTITNDSIIDSINASMSTYNSTLLPIILKHIALPNRIIKNAQLQNDYKNKDNCPIQIQEDLPDDIKSLIYYLKEDASSQKHDIISIFKHHYVKNDKCFLFNNEEWPNLKLLQNKRAQQCIKRSTLSYGEFKAIMESTFQN